MPDKNLRAFMDCTGKTSVTLLHNRHGAKGKDGGSVVLAISGSASRPETVPELPGKATVGIHQAALILPESDVMLDMLVRQMRENADLLASLAEAKRLQPEKSIGELWAEMAATAEREAQRTDRGLTAGRVTEK